MYVSYSWQLEIRDDLHPPAHQLNWYRFIGRVLGKALYEDILVDVAFAGFFLAKVDLIAPLFEIVANGDCSG